MPYKKFFYAGKRKLSKKKKVGTGVKRNIWILIAVVVFINLIAIVLIVGHNDHKETERKGFFYDETVTVCDMFRSNGEWHAVVYYRGNYELAVMKADSFTREHIFPHGIDKPCWSENHSAMFYILGNRLVKYDIGTSQTTEIKLAEEQEMWVYTVAETYAVVYCPQEYMAYKFIDLSDGRVRMQVDQREMGLNLLLVAGDKCLFSGSDHSAPSDIKYFSLYDGVEYGQIEELDRPIDIDFCDYIGDVMYYAGRGGELYARYLEGDEVKNIRIAQTSVLGLGEVNDRLICLTYNYSLGDRKNELCILNETGELSAFAAFEGSKNSKLYVSEEEVACLLGQNKVFTYSFCEDFFEKY